MYLSRGGWIDGTMSGSSSLLSKGSSVVLSSGGRLAGKGSAMGPETAV